MKRWPLRSGCPWKLVCQSSLACARHVSLNKTTSQCTSRNSSKAVMTSSSFFKLLAFFAKTAKYPVS
eukprot:8730424-Karenia_brevis.AAC.1